MLRAGASFPAFTAALLSALLAGCENSPTEPAPDPSATFTVDATSPTDWALVDLGSSAQLVQAADPTSSMAWDLGFQTTKVVVNGGADGPAGMVVYCLCQNAGATDADVVAMTPESERAEFEAITRNDIPAAGAGWSATAIADNPWYRYNLDGAHTIFPTFNVYFVKRGDEVYKVQVTSYYKEGSAEPRHITFRYAKLTD